MILCNAIKQRTSTRLYDKKKNVDYNTIYNCIEAAINAPSPHNEQPWIFRIITSAETIKLLANHLNNNRWLRTASAIVVIGTEKKNSIEKSKVYLAIGAAIENMLLEAEERGVGTCWIGECLGKSMEEMLNWPAQYEIVSMVAMGYKRINGTKKIHKKSVEEVLV